VCCSLLLLLLQVYRHGGVDVLSKELRPILLKYPVESSSSGEG